MRKPFVIPDFLQNQSVDEIHARMLAAIPEELDKSEGGFVYDFTRPTAIEKSRLIEFVLVEAVKNMFPLWAYGENLDNLGIVRGMPRKQATKAMGQVSVTAVPGSVVPKGSRFSTVSKYGAPSVEFETLEEVVIEASEESTVVQDLDVMASTEGKTGNVSANTIALLSSPISGVKGVRNREPTSGGTDTETDEMYSERLAEYDRHQGYMFVGSISDYRRWAMGVDGVGNAIVIPANDNTGIVRIVLTDAEGAPANEKICADVYNEIMRPEDPYMRRAPVNAYLEVMPPVLVEIGITATVRISSVSTIEEVTERYLKNLSEYFQMAMSEREVKYAMVGSILIETEGVEDYSGLLLNGGMANIPSPLGYLPVTDASRVVLSL